MKTLYTDLQAYIHNNESNLRATKISVHSYKTLTLLLFTQTVKKVISFYVHKKKKKKIWN